MAITVTDVRDLLQVLRDNPEWRAEVRREILGEELLALPELVAQNSRDIAANTQAIAQNSRDIAANTQAIAQNSRAIAGLQVTVEENSRQIAQNSRDIAANTQAIHELQEAVRRLEQTVAGLTQVMERVLVRLEKHDAEFGDLRGWRLEEKVRRSPQAYIRRRLRKMRVIGLEDLPEVDRAEESGALTEDQYYGITLLDMIVRGREGSGDAAREAMLAVEISWTIDDHDVARASERAAALRQVGYNAYAAVAGKAIDERAREAADAAGVEVFIDTGTLTGAPAA